VNSTPAASRPVTVARAYLDTRGLHILDQSWRHSTGEIDLAATDSKDVLIVCAVRVRTSNVNRAPHVLPARKVRLPRRLALRWQHEHAVRYGQIRVDVIVVTEQGPGGHIIEHVQGVDWQ
jgi:Holliday junction resolvase-like predicted endonuclease